MRVRQESTQDYSHLSSAMFSSSHRIQSLEDRLSRGGSIPNRMEEIVRAKFTQNQDMKQQLLATGNLVLEEGNGWHDTFWGVDLKTGEGENHLGRILMQVREELRGER